MRRVGHQDGFALPTAIMVLALIALLGTAAVVVATQTAHLSNRDANAKASLGAADGGLSVATYRLNMLAPPTASCVNTAVVAPTAGYCQAGPESIGNGGAFSFWMTPVLAAGASCAGLAVQGTTGISQRCITAIGTVNGISTRTEVRVAAFAATPLFPVPGLLGLKSVTVANNAQVNGTVGSNGPISISNNASVLASVSGPGGTISLGNNATLTTRNAPNASVFVLSPVDAGNSALAANNNNNRITNCASHVVPFDACSGTVTLDASRNLTVTNNASLTLGGGTYNFCGVNVSNNATLSLAATVKTRIFVDSPDDPNSGCPAGSGTFNLANNVNVVNPSADATALQIYVYGWNNGLNVVNYANNSTTYATVYAPQSTINLSNNAVSYGTVSGNAVNVLNNMTFNWAANTGSLQARSTGLFYRTAWEQCPAVPSIAGQPQAGC